MRDVLRLAEIGEAEIESRFPNKELTAGEIQQLVEVYKSSPTAADGLFESICAAYSMGFAEAKNAYLQKPEEQRSKTEKFILGWIASKCGNDCASCAAAEYIAEDEETCPVCRNM